MGSVGLQGGRAGGANGIVLAVDDEPMVLRILDRLLCGVGHRVALAHSAEQVERFMLDPDLAVVLLDLFMGQVSRTDLLAAIKRERPDVEVIVVTGYGSIDSAVRCMRSGAFDYLEKPFRELSRLCNSVGAAIARHDETLAAEATQVGLCVDERTPSTVMVNSASVPLSLEAYERLALERALYESGGDASRAAERLAIGRSTFYRKAAKLGIALRRACDIDDCDEAEAGVGGGPSIG